MRRGPPRSARFPYTPVLPSFDGVAARAGGAAVVRVAAVGDAVGEAVGAVVVGVRRVGAALAAAAETAVARGRDDRVAEVGVRGLDVGDERAEVEGREGVVLGEGVD